MEKTVRAKAVDGYSGKIKQLSEGMWEYEKDSSNGCLISEASLDEMFSYLSNCTFGMVSPVLPNENISNNVERLASFRVLAQGARIPLYHVVGKCYGDDADNNMIDKSFILIKPDHMNKEKFSGFMGQAIQAYSQDSFVIKSPGEDLLCVNREGEVIQRYSGNLNLNLLAKAYAYRLPIGKRFTFIGLEVPNLSIGSFQLFQGSKVEYYLPEDFFERKR